MNEELAKGQSGILFLGFPVEKRTLKHDIADIPHAYSVRIDTDAIEGIMVYGYYPTLPPGERWKANPNCRYLIAQLIDILQDIDYETSLEINSYEIVERIKSILLRVII